MFLKGDNSENKSNMKARLKVDYEQFTKFSYPWCSAARALHARGSSANIVVAAVFDFMTEEDWGEYK